MKSKKLDLLIEEMQKQSGAAQRDYEMGSMLSGHVHLERIKLCKALVNKINELYQTKYQIKEDEDNRREYSSPR